MMPIDPTDLELDYRAKNYPDSKAIERKQIACATCGKNLSAKIEKPGGVFIHPFMTTLQCKKCSDFYGDGEFSMDEDGDDKYCRMCGNGGELYICGNKPCPYGFCQKCIDRYIGKDSAEVQADDWKCLHCNCKPLWEVRAVSAVIILEKSKKRRKHRKYSTRGEVQVSDNDYNRSQDLDGDFQSFKRVSLRPSRAIANSRVKQKALEKLKEICDSSNDSSDNPDLHKSTVGKRNVNTRSRVTDAGASQSSSAKKNGPRSFKEKKRSSESEDETSDFEEKQTMREKYINSKFRTTFVEMESKSVASKKQNKQSSTQSHQKPLHLKEKNRRATESPENLKNPTSESDSESSHESANDFVRSIKKKNLKTQTQKSSKTDSVSQKKKLNVIESPNCRVDSKLSNTYFKKIVHDRKTPDSPVDSKITIRKTDNYFSKHSRTSKRRIESEGCTSESDHETYDSNKRAIPRKVSAPRVNRTNKQSSDSENEDIPKISGKVTKLSTVGRESGQRSQTKRLSTRPLTPTSQPSSSVDHNNGILDKRKSAIKCSYAKFSSSKDYVTKDQARIIKDRIGNLVSELRLFGKSLCAGANGIATKHLMNNVTSVQAVSKIVLKCALLMIRCKKSLDGIEHEFIESYESWCRISNVESLFADMEDIRLATSDKAESIIRENSDIDIGKRDSMTQDLNEERTTDHSDSDDDENCNINHQLAPNVSTAERETRKTRLGTKQKSVDSGDDLNNSSSSEKMDVNIPDPENEDSDRGSRNARHDAMSECDGEIFSDDERRTVQTEETNESRTKQICTQSPASSTSKSRLIESDSDEPGNVDRENLEEIEERSLPSDNEIEDPTNATEDRVSISQSGQDNQKKLIECSADKSPEIPARVESPSENKRQPDVSLEDIFDGADVSEHETTLMERPKDLSDGDRFLSNDLENENNSSTTEKSAPAETEVNRSSVDDVDDDDDTLDFWDRSKTNKSKSKLKASENTSSANLKENLETLSDCDATIIFTQSPYNDASNNSDADHTCENPEENLGTTEDSHMSNLEVVSDTDLPLQNDVNCTDVAGSSKERSKSPEAINELRKEVAVPDSDRNLESISDSPKTSRENIEKDMVVENDSTTLLPDNGGNDSSEGANAVEDDVELDSEKEQATALDVEEEAVKKKLLESESESSEDLERIEQIPVSYDSEEAAKKKVLESESEWSEDSLAISNNFKLKMNSDSDENNKQALPADTASNTVTSEISSAGTKSDNSKEEESKMDPTDTDDSSDLNNLAKQRLLSSSASSGSDIDDSLLELPTNTILSQSRSSGENSDTDQTSDIEKEIATITYWKTKRRKFDLEKNPCYKMDKKLQIDCRVVVRRLNEKVLDQFRQLLGKSRERQEQEDFERLLDLNSIKKRKRGTEGSAQSGSSSDSSSSKTSSRGNVKKTKSKQVQEKEETLLEHLEKMKNGENCCIPSADEEDENDDVLTTIPMDTNAEGEFLAQADKLVKDFLIQNSDSENDMLASVDDTEQLEQDEEPKSESPKEKTKQKEKDKPNEEAVDSGSNHENGSNAEKDNEEETANPEEDGDSKQDEDSDSDRKREMKKLKDGLAKRNWRLTDSDSSDEEKKWDKSQLKKSDEKSEEPKELASKQKKKVKRRVLGSDSDSVKLTDDSDDSVEMIDEKKNSSSDSEDSSELFKNLRTKRRRKRNANQKSDSDSESEQDEKPAKQKRKRIKKMESDSDSDALTNSQDTPGKLHRKNIRKVLKDKQVADVTKIAGKEEEERLKRIAERQKLYNEMYEMKLASEAKVDKLVLDFDEETKKELVSVHEGLVKRLKPHQAQGIKFMWDACFESLERIKTEKGSGCIVAHCMGLGKTFQVVTLAHTLLTHPETGIKTIMVICPLSTVLNWVNEFKKWLGDINNDEDVQVFEMTKMKKNFERKYQLEKWKRAGGVMVLGYEMFRLLSNQTGKKMRKSLHEGILKCLVDPGPDLIVCDEGHLLKNEDTALSKAMRRVKTLRRIVLTGTPLQNNLVEYHCMVQFVKPNLLGTKKEFLNRFVNPITNGQFDDSTEYDVKLMKKRAHVLHKMLEGSVQRFDYSVLTPFLPPKQEYVITVRLADIQIKLYQYYLDNLSRKKVGAGTSLFADFQALQRIWTHPIVLRMNAEKMEKINEKKRLDASDTEGSLVDFLDDGSDEKTTSSEDSDVQSASSSEEKKEKPRRGTRANPLLITPKEEEEELQPQAGEWWSQFVESEHFEDMKVSSKLVLLFAILKECEQIGDKVLVFSQSLYALSLIEEFLNKIDDETQRGMTSELIDDHSGSWSLGLDYFRLDGQTPPENRSHYCRIFNNPKNSRARLFLISTRAGGLGINLTAANRVIIFDASWNPSHDVQSIFRIYRFGQKKPCYVYRFLAQGTMEEKIYNRQVTKLSLSCRVVDEQQIERHYSNHDLAELYQFEPHTSKEKPTLNLPKDRLLAEILRKYDDRIETLHEHDSLLENKAEEELDEEERKEAWKEYEDERKGRKVIMNNFAQQNFAMQQYNDLMNPADIANRATLSGINIETLQALIRKDYPNSTPEQQTLMTQRAIMDMYTYMENEAIRQQQLAASSFSYPTVSNIGTSSFIDGNVVTPAQRQYALQQQQQLHQIMVQREQQANYAKRFGNVRGPALSATATRPPLVVNLQDDNDVIEIPTTPPASTGPTPSSSVQTPAAAAPAVAENSKRQEE